MNRSISVSIILGIAVIAILGVANVCVAQDAASSDAMKPLFNGKDLNDWVVILESEDGKMPDTAGVFTVTDGVIHCKGEPVGYIRTKEKHGDFKLTFEWRWVAEPTNSGCLVRIEGEDKVWPKSIEAQLANKNAGDIWTPFNTFKEVQRDSGNNAHKKKDKPSNEVEPGKWNKMEVVCKADTMKITVNGELQNSITGMTAAPEGYIAFQSEGSPIEFRNILIGKTE